MSRAIFAGEQCFSLRCCVACLCEQQSSFADLTKADITKFIRTNPCLKHLNYHLLGITLWAGS